VKNAIRIAAELHRSKANDRIDQELSAIAALARG
jgi:hypothetical protein